MRVLNYSSGADTGGQSIRLKQAFDRHSEIEYRSLARRGNYLEYPADVNPAEVNRWLRWADVIHANINFRGITVARPLVIHYHGTPFRRNPQRCIQEQRRRRAIGTASTLDLWLLSPSHLEWLPSPYDLEWLQTFRRPHDGPLRIGHAPTERGIKSTGRFLEAVDRLSTEVDVELVLIERSAWAECLEAKGTVDVFYDQVRLGYGNNAIEAWGMGIPVVCGAAPDTLAEMRNRFGVLPFYEATEDTIYDALRALVDPDVRVEYSERGLAHVRRWHAETVVVAHLEAIYGRAAGG